MWRELSQVLVNENEGVIIIEHTPVHFFPQVVSQALACANNEWEISQVELSTPQH